jgi:DNA-directed RNA polymerase specialized sigma24 family protein
VTFDDFLAENQARLTAGLVAAYGPEVGQEVAAEAVAYGWQHWDRLETMDNPVGYLYRVGQSAARSHHRPAGYLPATPTTGMPDFEPSLAPALEALSEQQRTCLILVHALGWPQVEAAELLGIDVSSLRTHIRRGLDRLRTALKVDHHV